MAERTIDDHTELEGNMATNFFESDETRRRAVSAARGDYQVSVLIGCESWSGSTLRGTAKQYGGRYRDSRETLLRTLRDHFVVEETVDGRAKAFKISERVPLDLSVRDDATEAAISQYHLAPKTDRGMRVLKAEFVESRKGVTILLATVYGHGIEGSPSTGPTVTVRENVYVVATSEPGHGFVVRDTIRKARISANEMIERIAEANRRAVAKQVAEERARVQAAERAADAENETLAADAALFAGLEIA